MDKKPSHTVFRSMSDLFTVDVEDSPDLLVSFQIPHYDKDLLLGLCQEFTDDHKNGQAVLDLYGNFVVVGDLHGSLFDLIRIIHRFGVPPLSRYLFLGDYVDKGEFSTEVIVILFAMRLLFPESVFLLRGNHEFPTMSDCFGMREEMFNSGYKSEVWAAFQDTFGYLPLAAIVNGQIFCTHAGLSPVMKSIADIRKISLPVLNFEDEIIAGLTWSDPSTKMEEFEPSFRGVGYLFGSQAIRNFMNENSFIYFIRAHQCVPEGIEDFLNTGLITVFSSSNYCKTMNNKSGVLVINEKNEIQRVIMNPQMWPDRREVRFARFISAIIPDTILRGQILKSGSMGPKLSKRSSDGFKSLSKGMFLCSGHKRSYGAIPYFEKKE